MTRTFQSGMTPAPAAVSWAGGAAAQQNAPLAGALGELCTNHYKFSNADTGAPIQGPNDIMSALARRTPINVALPESNFNWKVDSEERMEQFAFAQTKRDDLLPQQMAAQLKQIDNLKKNGLKFFTHRGATVGIGARIGPLWQLEAGSLFASYNNGNKVQVKTLDGLARSVVADVARSLGVAIPGLTDQVPAALQPGIARRPDAAPRAETGAPTASQARTAAPAASPLSGRSMAAPHVPDAASQQPARPHAVPDEDAPLTPPPLVAAAPAAEEEHGFIAKQ